MHDIVGRHDAARLRRHTCKTQRKLFREHIARGHFGVKSGQGLYADYRAGDEE